MRTTVPQRSVRIPFRLFFRGAAPVFIMALFLVAPVLAQRIPEGKPVGEVRLREWNGRNFVDLGTASDWERNHRQTGTTSAAPARNAGPSAPPQKTAEQVRQEEAQSAKNKGLDALAAGDYGRAITLLSSARASLPHDTTITDKLRQARAELMKKLDAEAEAQRRARIKSSIEAATASLESVFAALPPTAPLPAAWGDAMVVDLTDARTSAVDPRVLKGLDLGANEPLPSPPTGLAARPPEPDPTRAPKPTDAELLARFSSRKFEHALFEYQMGRPKNSAPSPRLHQMIDESLKLLDTVPMRPIRVKGSIGMDELDKTRPRVVKAVESFKARYHKRQREASWRAVREYSDFLQQLEDDGWWKKGADIQKAIAADPQLSRVVDEEAAKTRLRMLDYLDAAAEITYAELTIQMRAIISAGDSRP